MSFTFLAGNSGLAPNFTLVTPASTGDGTAYPVQLALDDLRPLLLTYDSVRLVIDLEVFFLGTWRAYPQYVTFPDGLNRTLDRGIATHQDILTDAPAWEFTDSASDYYYSTNYRARIGAPAHHATFRVTEDRFVNYEFLIIGDYGDLTSIEDPYGYPANDVTCTFFGESFPLWYTGIPFRGTIDVTLDATF